MSGRSITRKETMPPAKKTAAKKTAKRRGPRKVTVAHKRAMSQGRTESAIVNRYMTAITQPKQRGRKVSTATLKQRLSGAQARSKSGVGVDRVLAAQEVRDLRARIASSESGSVVDIKPLEREFV